MTDCILWEGCVNSSGYGQRRIKGKLHYVHRLAYTQTKGEIPEGLDVMHSCDNRRCYNPDHLSVGTRHDNMMDCRRKRRGPSLKLTDEQVVEIFLSTGSSEVVGPLYGISGKQVRRIRNRESHREVTQCLNR